MGYPGEVTKRLIEVDDDKLAKVRSLLGTTTLKATVDGALDEVLALDQRRQALMTERSFEDPLADPTRRQAAWR
jgi:Arc/MetJ family transcription regulator